MNDVKFRFVNRIKKTGEIRFIYTSINELEMEDSWQGEVNYERLAINLSTSLKDKNGKEIYEGDIRREEIETDEGDEREYYVCVWINEWSMFAWLHLPGEYYNYLDNGSEHLDTVMYWTYPASKDEESKIIVCGNIYQNPELLK